MTKEEFKKAFLEAMENPNKYFYGKKVDPKTGRTITPEERLTEFFQDFTTYYLDPSVAEVTTNTPKITFDRSPKRKEDRSSFEVGCYHYDRDNPNEPGKIIMNTEGLMSLIYKNKTGLASALITLCHEHQHFKQRLYSTLVEQGRTEEAEKIKPLLGVEKDGLSVSVDEIEECQKPHPNMVRGMSSVFMEETDPQTYKNLKFTESTLVALGSKFQKKKLIETSNYFNSAHEIDARENSLPVFQSIFSEIVEGAPNQAKLEKIAKSAMSFVDKFNGYVLKVCPQTTLDQFEELRKKFTPAQFVMFAEKTEEECKKANMNPYELHNLKPKPLREYNKAEYYHITLEVVLYEKLESMPIEQQLDFLKELKSAGNAYLTRVATIAEQKLSKSTTEPVPSSEIAETREEYGLKEPEVAAVVEKQIEHTQEQELEQELEEELEQNVLKPD